MTGVVRLPLKKPDDRSCLAADVHEFAGEEHGVDENDLPLLSDAELYVLVNQALTEKGMAPYGTVLEMLVGLRDYHRWYYLRATQIIRSHDWAVR